MLALPRLNLPPCDESRLALPGTLMGPTPLQQEQAKVGIYKLEGSRIVQQGVQMLVKDVTDEMDSIEI